MADEEQTKREFRSVALYDYFYTKKGISLFKILNYGNCQFRKKENFKKKIDQTLPWDSLNETAQELQMSSSNVSACWPRDHQ